MTPTTHTPEVPSMTTTDHLVPRMEDLLQRVECQAPENWLG